MHSLTTTRRRTVDPPFPCVDPDDDRERFAALYARHRDELARYCRSILRHDQDVEDALQSTMAKAFAALRTETREIALRPWLFRIAHNEAISILRRRVDAVELDDRDGGDPDPVARTVETRERLRLLQEDLRDLPQRQRSALVLRELSGLGHREIADVLGSSPAAVKQAIYEARCGLGDCAAGRSLACDAVRRSLSDGDGRAAGRRRLRAHLRSCRSCRAFDAALRQRPQDLGALFPAWPLVGAGGAAAGLLAGTGGGAAVGVGSATVGVGSATVGVGSAGVGGSLLSGGLAFAGAAKVAAITTVAVVAGGGAVAVERGTFASSGSGTERSSVVTHEAATQPSVARFAAVTGGAAPTLVVASPPGATRSSASHADSGGRGNRGPQPSRGERSGPSNRPSAERRRSTPGSPMSAAPAATRDRSDRGLGRDQGRRPADDRPKRGGPGRRVSRPVTATTTPRNPQASGAGTRRSGPKRAPSSATKVTGSAAPAPSSRQARGSAGTDGGGPPAQATGGPSASAGTPATGSPRGPGSPSGSASAGGPPAG